MNVKSQPLQFYVDRITAKEPFTFIRMGDGEWSAIFQDRDRTSSRSQNLRAPGLNQAMADVVRKAHKNGRYILALRRTAMKAHIAAWLEKSAVGVKWHDCTVFYKASKHGQLYSFVKAVRELGWPVVVVGPERLKKLDGKVFDIAAFVQLPNRDCWAMRRSVMRQCKRIKGPALFTFTAGPAAKPWCWELHKTHGETCFILDLGSLWDPYAGKQSRTYHKRLLRNPVLIKRNLTGMG